MAGGAGWSRKTDRCCTQAHLVVSSTARIHEAEWSQLRADLAALSVPALRSYRAVVMKMGRQEGTNLITEYAEELLRLVDYMIEEQADLHF